MKPFTSPDDLDLFNLSTVFEVCDDKGFVPTLPYYPTVGPNKQKQPTREPTRGERRTDRRVGVARIPQQVANRSTGREVRSKQ
jgi:hypothetical protein